MLYPVENICVCVCVCVCVLLYQRHHWGCTDVLSDAVDTEVHIFLSAPQPPDHTTVVDWYLVPRYI